MTHSRRVRGAVWTSALLALTLVTAPTAVLGQYSFDVQQISPSVQVHPTIDFLGPYFYFNITNTGSTGDQYYCEVRNLVVTPPSPWATSVCIGEVCYGDSLTVPTGGPLGAGMTLANVGVNLVPFADGVGTMDFHIESVGDPGLTFDVIGLTLYAGTASVGVDESVGRVAGLVLEQNSPNPVRVGTSISFSLPDAAPVSLAVFDVTGRLVETIAGTTLSAGAHTVAWDATDASGRPLPAGVYYYRLSTPAGALTKKMTLIH